MKFRKIGLLINVLLQSYAEREHGKVVVYTTSMGVVRQTYQRCLQVSKHTSSRSLNPTFCLRKDHIEDQNKYVYNKLYAHNITAKRGVF